jgi:MFS family permease
MAIPAALAPILRVFTYRQYALFMYGMSPNLITLWMQRVGVGWLAWELTRSPTWLGVIAAADLAPMIFLAPIAGAYTDRTNPIVQQIVTQWLNVAQATALAVLTFMGLMTIELLFVLSVLYGMVHPFTSTARHAIVPRTVPRAEFATAIAVDSAMFNGSRFVGPAVAGLIIPFGGIETTFALNAVACLFFIVFLHLMEIDFSDRKAHGGRRIVTDIVEGLRYVRRHPGIGPLFVLMAAASILLRPVQDMLPGFAGAVFDSGATGLAWLTSSMGVGAMLSAVWIAARGRIGGLTLVVVAGCGGLCLATFGFVATANIWVSVAFGTLSGFALNTMSTGTQALTQSALSDELRGRVMGLYTVIYRGLPAIGALGVGALAENLGLRWAFAGAAGLTLLACIWVLPRWRRMSGALESERAGS